MADAGVPAIFEAPFLNAKTLPEAEPGCNDQWLVPIEVAVSLPPRLAVALAQSNTLALPDKHAAPAIRK
jgi:hypothetical protein